MFENPRRGRQARNFATTVPKILDLKSSSEKIFFRKLSLGAPAERLCIKVGRGPGDGGHRDACVGTWDLGTRDEGLEDIKYVTRGRVGRESGNIKYRDAGDTGCK